MNYKEIYNAGLEKLNAAIPENPDRKLDARLLLEAACGTTIETLLADGDRPVTEEERKKYLGFLARRAAHEPVAYILGEQDFMGLPFAVTPDVLIPNQDTENLVEEAMKVVCDGWRILDLCTGSGCILLSLLQYSNDTTGVGTDLSSKALAVASGNAQKLGLSGRVQWLRGDLYGALENPDDGTARPADGRASENPDGMTGQAGSQGSGNPGRLEERTTDGKFEMIISNPPYIPTDVIPTLMPEVSREEPMIALDGGKDGLDFYRRIIDGADKYLVHGGVLLFETGFDEAGEVAERMKRAGFLEVSIYKDYGGQDRVVRGERR